MKQQLLGLALATLTTATIAGYAHLSEADAAVLPATTELTAQRPDRPAAAAARCPLV